MTFDEFLLRLDPTNRYIEELCDTLQGIPIIERKGPNFPEIIARCGAEKLYPVVDKKLAVVLGCAGGHGLVRQDLFRYHYYAVSRDRPEVGCDESEDRYIYEGHGWFISKMRPRVIVAGLKYRPDELDEQVFCDYKIEHQHLTREQIAQVIRGGLRTW